MMTSLLLMAISMSLIMIGPGRISIELDVLKEKYFLEGRPSYKNN
jgi:hypothetical protein